MKALCYVDSVTTETMTGVAGVGLTPTEQLAAERLRRKRQVALGYRLFAALRWGDLGDGHITARDPELTDCMWLLRSPVDFGQATIHDLVLVNPFGEVVDGGPAETPFNMTAWYIHHPIHDARPDIVGVAHIHSSWGTPFSAEARLLQPISQESCLFFEDHSLFDDEEVQILSDDGGRRIAMALADNKAVILRNHGLLTVGATVSSCLTRFVTMERVAEVAMKARDAKPISAPAARRAKEDLDVPEALELGFRHLVARHIGDPMVVG